MMLSKLKGRDGPSGDLPNDYFYGALPTWAGTKETFILWSRQLLAWWSQKGTKREDGDIGQLVIDNCLPGIVKSGLKLKYRRWQTNQSGNAPGGWTNWRLITMFCPKNNDYNVNIKGYMSGQLEPYITRLEAFQFFSGQGLVDRIREVAFQDSNLSYIKHLSDTVMQFPSSVGGRRQYDGAGGIVKFNSDWKEVNDHLDIGMRTLDDEHTRNGNNTMVGALQLSEKNPCPCCYSTGPTHGYVLLSDLVQPYSKDLGAKYANQHTTALQEIHGIADDDGELNPLLQMIHNPSVTAVEKDPATGTYKDGRPSQGVATSWHLRNTNSEHVVMLDDPARLTTTSAAAVLNGAGSSGSSSGPNGNAAQAGSIPVGSYAGSNEVMCPLARFEQFHFQPWQHETGLTASMRYHKIAGIPESKLLYWTMDEKIGTKIYDVEWLMERTNSEYKSLNALRSSDSTRVNATDANYIFAAEGDEAEIDGGAANADEEVGDYIGLVDIQNNPELREEYDIDDGGVINMVHGKKGNGKNGRFLFKKKGKGKGKGKPQRYTNSILPSASTSNPIQPIMGRPGALGGAPLRSSASTTSGGASASGGARSSASGKTAAGSFRKRPHPRPTVGFKGKPGVKKVYGVGDASRLTCYGCGKNGHFIRDCPDKEAVKGYVARRGGAMLTRVGQGKVTGETVNLAEEFGDDGEYVAAYVNLAEETNEGYQMEESELGLICFGNAEDDEVIQQLDETVNLVTTGNTAHGVSFAFHTDSEYDENSAEIMGLTIADTPPPPTTTIQQPDEVNHATENHVEEDAGTAVEFDYVSESGLSVTTLDYVIYISGLGVYNFTQQFLQSETYNSIMNSEIEIEVELLYLILMIVGQLKLIYESCKSVCARVRTALLGESITVIDGPNEIFFRSARSVVARPGLLKRGKYYTCLIVGKFSWLCESRSQFWPKLLWWSTRNRVYSWVKVGLLKCRIAARRHLYRPICIRFFTTRYSIRRIQPRLTKWWRKRTRDKWVSFVELCRSNIGHELKSFVDHVRYVKAYFPEIAAETLHPVTRHFDRLRRPQQKYLCQGTRVLKIKLRWDTTKHYKRRYAGYLVHKRVQSNLEGVYGGLAYAVGITCCIFLGPVQLMRARQNNGPAELVEDESSTEDEQTIDEIDFIILKLIPNAG